MKSTKYQLLKADYDLLRKDLKLYRESVERLQKEKEQSYYDGYKQGRADQYFDFMNQEHD